MATASVPVGRASRRRGLRAWAVYAAAVAAPLAGATLWIPVRTRLPNVDVALALVLTVMGVGCLGRRAAALVAAVSAATWFAYFDTWPYDRFSIARRPDVATLLVLAVVGMAAGLSTAAAARRGWGERSRLTDLTQLRSAAALVATSDELVEVVGALAGEIGGVLGASDCVFTAEEPDPAVPRVRRDGTLSPRPAAGPAGQLLVPVWAQGQLVGHYTAQVGGAHWPEPDRLRVASTLADQAGAALIAYVAAPDGPLTPSPPPRLRLLR